MFKPLLQILLLLLHLTSGVKSSDAFSKKKYIITPKKSTNVKYKNLKFTLYNLVTFPPQLTKLEYFSKDNC